MTDQTQVAAPRKPDWVGAMVGNPRFEFSARLCTGNARMRLIAKHLPTCTTAEVEVCAVGNSDLDAVRAVLCEKLAGIMLEQGLVERGIGQFARLLRCEYANRLIEIISSYGCNFFYSRKHDSVARLSFDQRVYLHDESGATIEPKASTKWPGFSHGGTLRDLVLQMRNYVMRGERIDPAYIGIDRHIGPGNIWGYSPEQMRLCREAAQQLPIIGAETVQELAA